MKPRAAYSAHDRAHRSRAGQRILTLALACTAPGSGFVYFVESRGLIKIGSASDAQTLGCRYNNARTWVPQLGFALVIHGGADLERLLHWRFGPLRVDGEWFRHEGELAAYVARYRGRNRCEAHETGAST